MTWMTNSITFVKCNDELHPGDPIHKIETGGDTNAVDAMKREGWSSVSALKAHFCPPCNTARRRHN